MSIFQIEDNLVLNEGSETLKKQFEAHCKWCWAHGFGDCKACKKRFKKYYIPLRKEEVRAKNGFLKGE